MINECIDTRAFFGINLFAERKMHLTGCTAWIDEVVSRLENGEMQIVTKGEHRYRVNDYQLSAEGFYTGKIEFLYEDNLDYAKAKLEKCVKIYNDLVELVYKGTIKKIDLNDMKWYDGKRSVAFSIAEKSGLSLPERQNILEIDIEDKRLDFILKYFEELIPKLKDADRISKIIKSDGYIQ